MMKIPLTIPWTDDREIAAVSGVIRSGWITQGPKVTEFENFVADYLGVKFAIASCNCTTSLHLALLIHNLGAGDEIIVPSYTWIATANVVKMVGAVPIFADIDLSTYNLTSKTVKALIGPKTKAIVVVHQFGMPADLDDLEQLCHEKGLILIEDAACALGSKYKGKKIGGVGNRIACFSFHPRKLISTGEGGILATNNPDWAKRARILLNHGASVSDIQKHQASTIHTLKTETFKEVGYNYRMTNIQGAIGVEQMKKLSDIIEKRRQKAEIYSSALAEISTISIPEVPKWAEPNWQSYVIRILHNSPVSRDGVAEFLLRHEIACRPAYMACHMQPAYSNCCLPLDLPATREAIETVLILPLYPQMTNAEQGYVITSLKKALNTN